MNRIVFSIGGSILFDENGNLKIENLEIIKEVIGILVKENFKVGVCVGGGIYARKYIEEGEKVNLSVYDQHYLGLLITQINAYLLAKYLKLGKVYYSFYEITRELDKNNVFIIGGLVPGFTTDVDTAILAKAINSKVLINVTNVDGIYDKDPRKFKDAKLIKKISYEDFLKLAKNFKSKPGVNFVFDPRAVEILKGSNVKIFVVNVKELKKLINFLIGKEREYPGSLIEI